MSAANIAGLLVAPADVASSDLAQGSVDPERFPDLTVADARRELGSVYVNEDGTAVATDAAGGILGTFGNLNAARSAVVVNDDVHRRLCSSMRKKLAMGGGFHDAVCADVPEASLQQFNAAADAVWAGLTDSERERFSASMRGADNG